MLFNEDIGNGQPWDLDRVHGGVYVLPPYQKSSNSDWYKGTANAIYQNINFMDRYNPEYVVILSGDHIYKMDYSEMLAYHKEKNADCTIAVMEVPMEEASRFGIMATEADGKVYEFQEKPKQPKSNLASMGIYIFSYDKLRKYLVEDEADENSENDFGKNIIPNMLNDGQRLYAWSFNGYWKDVGTIDSLWEANMDLLNPSVPLDLYDESWKIYARNPVMPPQYVGDSAVVNNSMVSEGCEVYGDGHFSVLFPGVVVEEGAKVHNSIVMPGGVVKKGAVIEYAIIAEDTVIDENAKVGSDPTLTPKDEWGVAVVGAGVHVGKNAVVPAKSMIEENVPEVCDHE